MGLASDIREAKRDADNLQYLRKTGAIQSDLPGFLVLNTEAATLPRFSVVELIGGALNSATYTSYWMSNETIINARKPLTGAVKLAILTDSIPAGKIGRAEIAGILRAKVNVSSTSHEFATIANGSEVLVSAETGEFYLLNCTGTTGLQYAYVSLAGGAGGSGSTAAVCVEIIEGLTYDTETVTGRSAYLCRLTTDNTAEWASEGGSLEGGDYPLDYIVKGSDNRKYQCTTSAGSGTMNPTADTTNANWTILEDEVVVRMYHEGVVATDYRKYLPWLKAGKIYPVRLYNGEYYFELNFTYIGAPGNSNFIVDETTGQVYVAVGDTFSI